MIVTSFPVNRRSFPDQLLWLKIRLSRYASPEAEPTLQQKARKKKVIEEINTKITAHFYVCTSITSNDHPFSRPIIYRGTIHITSNDRSFNCPVIYMYTIHSTRNDHLLSCPCTYMATYHYAIVFRDKSTILDTVILIL